MQQTTDTLLLVRPHGFSGNEQTRVNNYFQSLDSTPANIQTLALAEFDNFRDILEQNHIRVITIQDNGLHDTPDSIFPNNVISFHGNTAILYPMFAKNRQQERQLNYLGELEKEGLFFHKTKDYSTFEEQEMFLEGTGVIILDRLNNIAYCSLSERANEEMFMIYCEDNGYKPIVFRASQLINGRTLPIYHTNVMLSIGNNFSIICLESIRNEEEKEMVLKSLIATHKEVIDISEEQMNHFAANILEVHSTTGNPFIVMSEQAYHAFTDSQIKQLSQFGQILYAPLYTIEKFGGGSARCMIAEVFY